MTEPEYEYEYGVEFVTSDGVTSVSSGMGEATAHRFVRDLSSVQWNPRAVRVVRRPVAAWSPVPPEGKTQR